MSVKAFFKIIFSAPQANPICKTPPGTISFISYNSTVQHIKSLKPSTLINDLTIHYSEDSSQTKEITLSRGAVSANMLLELVNCCNPVLNSSSEKVTKCWKTKLLVESTLLHPHLLKVQAGSESQPVKI